MLNRASFRCVICVIFVLPLTTVGHLATVSHRGTISYGPDPSGEVRTASGFRMSEGSSPSRTSPLVKTNHAGNDNGLKNVFDCSLAFEGLDEVCARWTSDVSFDPKGENTKTNVPCAINLFNPSFEATENVAGCHPGHVRMLGVRNCSCKGVEQAQHRRSCIQHCLDTSGMSTEAARDFWHRNYMDATVGGWLHPGNCSFKIDPHTVEIGGFDRRDFGADSGWMATFGVQSTIQRVEKRPHVSNGLIRYGSAVMDINDPNALDLWTFIIRGDGSTSSTANPSPRSEEKWPRQSRLVYSSASGPCYMNCSILIPQESLDVLCNDAESDPGSKASLSLAKVGRSQRTDPSGGYGDGYGFASLSLAKVGRSQRTDPSGGFGDGYCYASDGYGYSMGMGGLNLVHISKLAAPAKIQEKNWSPFLLDGRRMFVYSLQPLRVCELERESSSSSCSFCREVSSTAANISHMMQVANMDGLQYSSKDKLHLNGLQLFRAEDGYIGVGHRVKKRRSPDRKEILYEPDVVANSEVDPTLADGTVVTNYTHFFFRISEKPPFQLLGISLPVPLKHAVSTAAFWKDLSHDVDTSFISGFSLLDGGPAGKEFLIAYGSGDDDSRLMKLPLSEALALFPKRL